MAFTWTIKIVRKSSTAVGFEPNPLPDVQTGDQIIWNNTDSQTHWPGLKTSTGVNQTYFTPYQIPGQSSSQPYVVAPADATAKTLTYVLQTGEQGTIQVVA